MPIYEYRCPACGVFEFQQKITAAPLESCPQCGQKVQRLIGRNVNIIYKASGFYITDNRKPEPREEEGAKKEEKEAATSSSKTT